MNQSGSESETLQYGKLGTRAPVTPGAYNQLGNTKMTQSSDPSSLAYQILYIILRRPEVSKILPTTVALILMLLNKNLVLILVTQHIKLISLYLTTFL